MADPSALGELDIGLWIFSSDLTGTGGGVIGAAINLDASGLPLRPFLGNFDHNGKNDLFALSGFSDRVNLWLAHGNGELSGARSYDSTLPTAAH